MDNGEYSTRKLAELEKGDIVYMRIPFEENTPDYYNGYKPEEIRGGLYQNRLGETSKTRQVVVVGHDKNSIQYLTLTSRSNSKHDSKHQYTLQDNSMTKRKDPDMKSYVEVDSLRSVYANPKWDIAYTGRVSQTDMVNIIVRLGTNEIDFESCSDQMAYVSNNRTEEFEKRLDDNGYKLERVTPGKKIYKNGEGRTVEKSEQNVVRYHVPLSKKEVAEMVAVREGRPADDFTMAVADITEKSLKTEVSK